MGLYDRQYYGEEERPSLFGGRTVVTNLIIVNCVLFLIDAFVFGDQPFNRRPSGWMALQPDLFSHPWQAWQLLTYGFAHDYLSIWHVAMNMIVLWFVGRELETIYGRKELLTIYLCGMAIAGLAWAASVATQPADASPPLVGASGAVWTLAAIFTLRFPFREILFWGIFPLPLWALSSIYFVLNLMGAVRHEGSVAYVAHIAGGLFGLAYFKLNWNLSRFITWPNSKSLHWRPKLKLHKPDQSEDLGRRVDEILAKVSRTGESSLTPAERRTLMEASKRYQRRREV